MCVISRSTIDDNKKWSLCVQLPNDRIQLRTNMCAIKTTIDANKNDNVKINISEKVIHTFSRNRGQKYKGTKQIKLLLTNQLLLLLLLHRDISAVRIEQLLCFACYNPEGHPRRSIAVGRRCCNSSHIAGTR
jgi:hypothetical protein